MLSGRGIAEAVKRGTIVIDPFNESQLGENSYDLRLGKVLKTYDASIVGFDRVLDMRDENLTTHWEIPAEGFILRPGVLYLGHTEEYTETHEYVPCLEGRSSVGRLGMQIHATAGYGDRGFCGDWTLEIQVVHALKVYAGVRICQIYYHTIDGEYGAGYKGKYQQQRGPKPSRLFVDFREKS